MIFFNLPWSLDSKYYAGLLKQQCLPDLRLSAASEIRMNGCTGEARLSICCQLLRCMKAENLLGNSKKKKREAEGKFHLKTQGIRKTRKNSIYIPICGVKLNELQFEGGFEGLSNQFKEAIFIRCRMGVGRCVAYSCIVINYCMRRKPIHRIL